MLTEILNQTTEKFPEKTAIIYDKQKIKYRELQTQVISLSKGLKSIGIEGGDCTAIILPNCPENYIVLSPKKMCMGTPWFLCHHFALF